MGFGSSWAANRKSERRKLWRPGSQEQNGLLSLQGFICSQLIAHCQPWQFFARGKRVTPSLRSARMRDPRAEWEGIVRAAVCWARPLCCWGSEMEIAPGVEV